MVVGGGIFLLPGLVAVHIGSAAISSHISYAQSELHLYFSALQKLAPGSLEAAVLTLTNIGAAGLILFFAFAGAESALSASGEIKNPTRTVRLGLLVGLLGILA